MSTDHPNQFFVTTETGDFVAQVSTRIGVRLAIANSDYPHGKLNGRPNPAAFRVFFARPIQFKTAAKTDMRRDIKSLVYEAFRDQGAKDDLRPSAHLMTDLGLENDNVFWAQWFLQEELGLPPLRLNLLHCETVQDVIDVTMKAYRESKNA